MPPSSQATCIKLSIPRASKSNHSCIFHCRHPRNLSRIAKIIRLDVLLKKKIFISENSRCCKAHLNNDKWDDLIGQSIKDYAQSDVEEMLELLLKEVNNLKDENRKNNFNFEFVEEMSDETLKSWTNMNKDEFLDLSSKVVIKSQNPRTALGLYISKLTTGETNKRLASIFSVSRSTAERMMKAARTALTDQFVPMYLGVKHHTREIIQQHNTDIAKTIFCQNDPDAVVSIWDGTYVYIQKSGNYSFQRKSFSMHKHRPLFKPFLGCFADGYIIDIVGPFEANVSDSTIMKDLFFHDTPLTKLFRAGDTFVLDRGFRDAREFMESKDYQVKMPGFIPAGSKQLSCIDANSSRLVIKVRYIVEALIKCFPIIL
jgi:DNA-dependent RNA polymerase auxiliary subunit epsilon